MSTEAPKEPEELIIPMGMMDIGHPAFALSARRAE